MTDILMPALSPTMEEGTLAKWNIKEGDTVSAGQVIAEIETDKATMEVEAVDEGVVEAILVPAGTEGVKVNVPIARLAGGDGASANGRGAAEDAAAAGVAVSKGNAGEDRAGNPEKRPLESYERTVMVNIGVPSGSSGATTVSGCGGAETAEGAFAVAGKGPGAGGGVE